MKDQIDGIRLRPLGEVVDLISGQHIAAKDYNVEGRGVPYLTGPSDFGVRHPVIARWTEHPKKFAQKGDILVTVKGSGVGSINVVDIDELAISRQLMAIRAMKAEPRFIELFLSLQGSHFQQRASGAAIPGLSRHNILDLEIPLPPLEEQKRIVAVLDQAFAALDRARARAEANLADAGELFEAAKRRFLSEGSASSQTVTLGDVAGIETKLVDPREPEYIDLRHVGAGNMITGSDQLIDVLTARQEKLKSGKFLFEPGMVLYSKIRPYLRKVARPEFSGVCSADVYPLRPKSSLDKNFLFHMLLGKNFTDYAIAGSDRAGMPKVNREHLFGYEFELPSLKVQQKIVDKVDAALIATDTLREKEREKLTQIESLRQSMLQTAFCGQLTA